MKNKENCVKMTLADYYKKLPSAIAPKTVFVNEVVAQCGVTVQAVYSWFHGRTPSSKHHCDIVSQIAGVPAEQLFPGYKEKYLKGEEH